MANGFREKKGCTLSNSNEYCLFGKAFKDDIECMKHFKTYYKKILVTNFFQKHANDEMFLPL